MLFSFKYFLLSVLYLSVSSLAAASFPFTLPWDDNSSNVTNLSWLNHKPAGVSGSVSVGADGHFYIAGQRQRFLGVNITAGDAFPPCTRSPAIAKRLARMGINVVRFHHLENDWTENIFVEPGSTTLDTSALDRLECLMAALKAEGIYIDMDLLVSRTFSSVDGLPAAIDTVAWKDQQTIAIFDSTMIQLQKDYATNLLSHVNPYTGMALKDDPALAFVEILNEHGLHHAWHSGSMDTSLPSPFSDDLRGRWNTWLKNKYGSHAALLTAWGKSTPAGLDMVLNGNFSSGSSPWQLESGAGGSAATWTTPLEGQGGTAGARIDVTVAGTAGWHVQFKQQNFNVDAAKVYTLSFDVRADSSVNVNINLGQQNSPWGSLGFSQTLPLTTAWQSFTYTFSPAVSESQARIVFSDLGLRVGTYWIDNLSFAEGGQVGVYPDENLDNSSIRLFSKANQAFRNTQSQQDWMEFLYDIEESYYAGMKAHLKTTLGITALITGSQISNTTPNLMAPMDYIDTHAYWQHPSFNISWGSPWKFRNITMLGDSKGGNITSLANQAVVGRGQAVSEYNTPYPNSFGAETYSILGAYGAFQDWDALYAFAYLDTVTPGTGPIDGFFDPGADPAKMLGMWNAALLFRRGDVAPGITLAVANDTKAAELAELPKAEAWNLVTADDFGMPKQTGLLHRVGMLTQGMVAPPGSIPAASVSLPATGIYDSDTGELKWNTATAVLTVNTANSKAVMGKGDGNTYSLGGVEIRPQSSDQAWSIIHVQKISGYSLVSGASSVVITAVGWVLNSNLPCQQYPASSVSTCYPPPEGIELTTNPPGNFGGAPVLAEGIGAQILLPYAPSDVSFYALDERGNRKTTLAVLDEAGQARLDLSAAHQTLWYEVKIGGPAVPGSSPTPLETPQGKPEVQAAIPVPSPNPSSISVQLKGRVERLRLRVFSVGLTKVVEQESAAVGEGWSGYFNLDTAFQDLANGAYYFEVVAMAGKEQSSPFVGRLSIIR